MHPKLIVDEGPLKGLVLSLHEGEEWFLGRDPDVCQLVIEDPKVSRQHALFQKSDEQILLSNLSRTNPILIDERPLEEKHLLSEGDRFKIGSNWFLFTTQDEEAVLGESLLDSLSHPEETLYGGIPSEEGIEVDLSLQQRWLLKVVSGPQSGAEFSMEEGHSYLIGSDPAACDILFYDLSVSKKHALITITKENRCFIEDKESRNGILMNGQRITQKQELLSQEIISLGTSSFVIIDREKAAQTIVAPSLHARNEQKSSVEGKREDAVFPPHPSEQVTEETKGPHWKVWISSHPIWSGLIGVGILLFGIGTFSLFDTTNQIIPHEDVAIALEKAFENYPHLTYSFNASNGHLFVAGHVLTPIEKTQLQYILKNLHFIAQVDDNNVLVDQLIWQEMNALLSKNPAWNGVSMYASSPGVFTISGYLKTRQEFAQLIDYLNLNFPYMDKLQNRVVVEEDLQEMIVSQLLGHGFNGITVQVSNGEVALSGFIASDQVATLSKLIEHWRSQQGVRAIKNFVVPLTPSEAVINLSDRYHVTGFSMKNNTVINVVINGLILSRGDLLDRMTITSIQSNVIFLEKDGLKYKINYNS